MTNQDELIHVEKSMRKKAELFRRFYPRSGWKAFWLQFGDWDDVNKAMVKKLWKESKI